jgi:tetratricopeptide (TPR) repeat protein
MPLRPLLRSPINVSVGKRCLTALLILTASGMLAACEVRGAADYLISGNEAFQRNDYKEAEADYRHALKAEPNSSTALNNLGVILNELGRYDEAIDILSRAVKVDPKNTIAHYALSTALSKQGQYDRAMEEARTAISLSNSDLNGHRALANAALLKAKQQNNSDALHVAIEEYRTILQSDSDDDHAHQSLGVALGIQGDKEGALSEEKKAVELNPDNLGARKELARLLHDSGSNDEALKELDTVLEKDKTDAEARKMRDEIKGS